MRRARLIAILAGAAGGASWLPFGMAPLYVVSGFLLIRALRRATTQREALQIGLLFGAARYALAAHFLLTLLRYSPLAIAFYLMAIVYILPFAALESWGAFWLEQRTRVPRAIGFVVLYTLLEKLRTFGELSFPADLLSNGLGTNPEWLGWSSFAGPFATSFWAFSTAALIDGAMALHRKQRRRALALALSACLLWIAPLTTAPMFSPEPADDLPTLRVGIVQPFIKVQDKIDKTAWPRLWARLERLTRRAAQDAELVLWPESTRPGPVIWQSGTPFRDVAMETLSRKVGVPILYGTDLINYERQGAKVVSTRVFNGAALVTPEDGAVDWYGKQRLLPFAESMPFGALFGWDPAQRARRRRKSLLTVLGNYSPGPRPTVFEVGVARIGVLICYESFYPEIPRRYRQEGANTLAVMTNDAWWGHGVFPYWHARMVAARARELDMPVLRAANNGLSGLLTRDGEMTTRTKLDELTTLRVKLRPSGAKPTFYARHGDLLTPLLLIFLACASLRALWQRRRESTYTAAAASSQAVDSKQAPRKTSSTW